MVQEQVAELEAKLAKLTAEFNAANHDKQEVRRSREPGTKFLSRNSCLCFRQMPHLASCVASLADVIWLDLNGAEV